MVNYHPETSPQYIFDIVLMAVQFYACNSLFTPLSISGEDGSVDHERLHTQRHTHLLADCNLYTRRIAGGGADSRISELPAYK